MYIIFIFSDVLSCILYKNRLCVTQYHFYLDKSYILRSSIHNLLVCMLGRFKGWGGVVAEITGQKPAIIVRQTRFRNSELGLSVLPLNMLEC